MKRYKRWNFSSTEDGIVACDGGHEKGQRCSHKVLTIEETLQVILEMQEQLPVEVLKKGNDIERLRDEVFLNDVERSRDEIVLNDVERMRD